MGWLIGVELPGGLSGSGFRLSQPSTDLRALRPGERLYPLRAALDAVALHATTEPEELRWELPSEEVRVFRLSGLDLDRGSRTQRARTGTFLVVVPQDSRPEGESPDWVLSGPEQIKGVRTPAYVLRFADLAPNAAFITKEGERLALPRATAGAELSGLTTDDELSDACGRLFIAEPPRLTLREDWRPTNYVVVEEPAGERSWRADGPDFDLLRAEIAARGSGWFSIRCYDDRAELLESIPFRFSASLKGILLDDPPTSALPGPNGHGEVLVQFRHGERCRLSWAGSGQKLFAERDSVGTRVLVPRNSKCDVTRWQVFEGQSAVHLAVRVERVWWALSADVAHRGELDWTDESLDLRRDDLAPTSTRVLHVRLPRPNWRAWVGFTDGSMLPMQRRVGSLDYSLPLRNLTDQRGLEAVGASPSLWIVARSPKGGAVVPTQIARVRALVPRSPHSRGVDTAARRAACVATTLTRVARSLPGCERRAVLACRRERYTRGRRGSDALREEFVYYGLCLLDVLCERGHMAGVSHRWSERARKTSRELPELREEAGREFSRAVDTQLP